MARVEGPTFTPGDDEVGLSLRVRAVYKDANGVLETVFSAPTGPIAERQRCAGRIGDDQRHDADRGRFPHGDQPASPMRTALTTSIFTYQWQSSANGTDWIDIPFARNRFFFPGNADAGLMLRVVVSYIDDQGTAETVTSAATAPVLNIPTPPLGVSLDNFFVFENAVAGDVIAGRDRR